jgi:hypothetical protein
MMARQTLGMSCSMSRKFDRKSNRLKSASMSMKDQPCLPALREKRREIKNDNRRQPASQIHQSMIELMMVKRG